MKTNKRRKKLIYTPVQRKLLFLIFASAVIPAGIAVAALYYLIFSLLSWQMGIPEAIAYNLLPVVKKVNLVILVAMPVVLLAIWFIALELSHRIAGPIYRLEKELDERLSGKASGSEIKLREKDELQELADKINRLLKK